MRLVSVGRRSLTFLVLAAAGLLVFNVAAVVVLLQKQQPPSQPAPAPAPEAPPLSATAPPKDNPLASPVKVKLDGEVKPAPKQTAKTADTLLEAVGGLSAAHLYQSYLNIGLLADAVENETYTEKDAKPYLQQVNNLLGAMDQHLGKVAAQAVETDDQKALQNMRTTAGLLKQQANALLAYWSTADETQATRYHQVRDQAWTQLKDLLDLAD